MGEQFIQADYQAGSHHIDVSGLASRLDRTDVLLLREFYLSGSPYPHDTVCHVLRLLADRVRRSSGPLGRLSYGAVRYRLENLVALGLIGKIERTNPAVYYPLDEIVEPVRRIILLFAAEFVGILRGPGGGRT